MPSDIQVTNIKANDGTAGLVIADSTGNITIAGGNVSSGNTAKVWCLFNSVPGTPTITDSFNTSSLSDHATGDLTINYSSAVDSASHTVIGSCGTAIDNPSDKSLGAVPVSTTSCRVEIYNMGGSQLDQEFISIVVFGD